MSSSDTGQIERPIRSGQRRPVGSAKARPTSIRMTPDVADAVRKRADADGVASAYALSVLAWLYAVGDVSIPSWSRPEPGEGGSVV